MPSRPVIGGERTSAAGNAGARGGSSTSTTQAEVTRGGADGTSLDIAGQSLVAIHDWTFLLGPGSCVGVNGILLGWMMYRTGLMPPRLAMLGVIGGPLIFVSAIAVLFGAYEQDGLHALFSVPEAAFEAAFAIYLIVKGFRPSPNLDDARLAGGGGGSLRPAAAP